MSEDAPRVDDHGSPARILELRGISKAYGHVRALTNVDFHVRTGETIGLLGDNGAGKSTLVKVMAGVVRPDSGTVLWNGAPVSINSRRDSARLGIEPIYQDGALCDAMPIWRNTFLGRELAGPLGFLNIRAMRDQSLNAMRSLVSTSGVGNPDTWISDLSGGQRQAVAIARAVFFKRTILLLDEPTSALGVRETEAVLAYIRRLKEEGVSSVFITHNMFHSYQVCDRFVVMSHGEIVLEVERAATSVDELTRVASRA